MTHIGGLNETQLHRQLKRHYCAPGGELEAEVDGFVVDVRNPDGIVEVQTGGFSRLRRKISALASRHPLRIVYPIAARTVIVKLDGAGQLISRRQSPKHGRIEQLYRELVSIADLLRRVEAALEVPFIEVQEQRCDDGRGSWRRGGVSILGRTLLSVGTSTVFCRPSDYLSVLPPQLAEPFTHKELARMLGLRVSDGQPITSALRKLGVLAVAGRRGREYLFSRQ